MSISSHLQTIKHARFIPVCLLLSVNLWSGEYEKLQQEAGEWQDKIKNIKKKIEKAGTKARGEKADFTKYKKRHTKYRSSLKAQADSLRKDQRAARKKAKSLAAVLGTVKQQQKEFDLHQERLKKQLLASCEKLHKILKSLPPSNIQNQIASLEFLQSELATNAVDNAEGLERFWQLLNNIYQASQTIEVYIGPSPIPSLKGRVYYIRLGFVYLAAIADKGKTGALWVQKPGESEGAWQPVEDKKMLHALWKGVQVQEGKAVPEVVILPVEMDLQQDPLVNGGQE